jgi:hypothetical protein
MKARPDHRAAPVWPLLLRSVARFDDRVPDDRSHAHSPLFPRMLCHIGPDQRVHLFEGIALRHTVHEARHNGRSQWQYFDPCRFGAFNAALLKMQPRVHHAQHINLVGGKINGGPLSPAQSRGVTREQHPRTASAALLAASVYSPFEPAEVVIPRLIDEAILLADLR